MAKNHSLANTVPTTHAHTAPTPQPQLRNDLSTIVNYLAETESMIHMILERLAGSQEIHPPQVVGTPDMLNVVAAVSTINEQATSLRNKVDRILSML